MKYIVGSDRKTVEIAIALCDKINAAIAGGNFIEAERLIAAGLASPNQPFRAEFEFRAGTNLQD